MRLILILDNQNGMMFNHRRQSQDRILRKKMLQYVSDRKLYMNAFSAEQFETGDRENILVDENFLQMAGKEDFCFVEDKGIEKYFDKIEEILVFKWNKQYPADSFLGESISSYKWNISAICEFVGSSHDKITMEVWKK